MRELVAAFPWRRTGRRPARTSPAYRRAAWSRRCSPSASPELFSSTLAACAPIGSFRQQINYVGDFRALFDYYFPGVLPGSPVAMPPAEGLIFDDAPRGLIVPVRIAAALSANTAKALELMRVARVAHDPAIFATVINSAINLLRYNVMGTFDAQQVLGGNPYGNRGRWYFGSSNDLRLNLLVRRYTAEPTAVAAMARVRDRRRPAASRWSPCTPPPTRSRRSPTSCSTCPRSTGPTAASSFRFRSPAMGTATSPPRKWR